MPNDRLEALVSFGVLRLPQFDGSVGTRRDQNFQTVDRRVDQFADLAFVSLR